MKATERRPVTNWRRASTRVGRFRQWFLHRVVGHETETCDHCGKRYHYIHVWWCIEPELWRETYERATGALLEPRGSESYAGALCPPCFVRFSPVTLKWEVGAL